MHQSNLHVEGGRKWVLRETGRAAMQLEGTPPHPCPGPRTNLLALGHQPYPDHHLSQTPRTMPRAAAEVSMRELYYLTLTSYAFLTRRLDVRRVPNSYGRTQSYRSIGNESISGSKNLGVDTLRS